MMHTLSSIRRFLLLLLTAWTPGLLMAQPDFIRDSLDTYMQRALAQWQVPGAAVCVIQDGQVLAQRGYGVCTLGQSAQVDTNTLFLIGSNTKAFTGTALALLAQEGKCDLDDRVTRWYPGFRMQDPYLTREITLTDILCHRMGLETFQGDFMYWTSDLSAAQVIEKFGQITPLYGFRSKWGYTNAGFVVAGACIEAISGQTWAEYMQNRFFTPLGMTRTRALTQGLSAVPNTATPHTWVRGRLEALPFPDLDNLAPAASIASSVSDMRHWVSALLDSGRYAGQPVLSFEAIKATRVPVSVLGRTRNPYVRTHYALYGLGWELQDYDGWEIVSHTGGVNGFVTSVTLVPEKRLGIIVLTNTDHNGLYEAAKRDLLDACLGLPFRNYHQRYLTSYQRNQQLTARQHQAWQDTVAMNLPPAMPLKMYAGTYSHPIYGKAEVVVQDNHLILNLEHHPREGAVLECLGGNRFRCTYQDPTLGVVVIPFIPGKKTAAGFTLRVADFVEFTTYDFTR